MMMMIERWSYYDDRWRSQVRCMLVTIFCVKEITTMQFNFECNGSPYTVNG